MNKTRSAIRMFGLWLVLWMAPVSAEPPVTENIRVSFQTRQVFAIEDDRVYASNLKDGARLNGFAKVGENHYQATISPENKPVNASAYYAFQIWSDEPKTITLSLNYTHHKHRYIPKLSKDGKRWEQVQGITLDRGDKLATFPLALTSEKQWVAAQEVTTSEGTYAWVDGLLASRKYLEKQRVGKTVQGKELYLLTAEQPDVMPSAVLVARQHPPETPGGTVAFKAFLEEVLSSARLAKTFRKQFNLYVFPLLNPDGADLGHWRHNANGVDLNRDWIKFSQPETRAVRDFVINKVKGEGKTIWFGIDFHTSYSGPYLLILNAENEEAAQTRVIPAWIQKMRGNPQAMTQYRRRDQALPYGYNWFYRAFGSEAVTYEDGDETDRETIRARARLYARTWMEAMLEQSEVRRK